MIKAIGDDVIKKLDAQRGTIDVIEHAIENEEIWQAIRQVRCFATVLLTALAELENCHEVELKRSE